MDRNELIGSQSFATSYHSSQEVEKYQTLYNKNPKSKTFALLSEGYLQLGLLKESLQIAQDGVRQHPKFPGGHIVLSRILMQYDKIERALQHLKIAIELSPQNLLAHRLMAEAYLDINQPTKAIRALKRILLFNPEHKKTQRAVKKLENLINEASYRGHNTHSSQFGELNTSTINKTPTTPVEVKKQTHKRDITEPLIKLNTLLKRIKEHQKEL